MQGKGLATYGRIVLLVLPGVLGACAQPEPRREAGPMDAAIAALETQLQSQPDDPLVAFMLASYYVQGGKGEKAIPMLDRIATNTVGIFPPPDRFHPIAHLAEYQGVLRKFEASQPPVLRGRVAYTVAGAPMVTEGIAYDPAGGALYLGSAQRKIVRVSKDGRRSDLTAAGQDGLATPLGMKVDARRGILWVASYRDATQGGDGQPGVYAFGLRTGKTVEKHTPAQGQGAPATFNDLVVARDGTVYVTDTASGALYRIRRGGALEAFLPAGTFRGPNGIALSPDEKFAFVAQWRAPVRVELQTGKLTPLKVPAHVVTAGIDGLYYHRGGLIGVQNVAHPGRLVRFTLNDAMDAITGAEVLESRNPHFATPTTAAIVGEHAYVLANSYVGWEKDGKLVTGEEMKPTVIVKVPL